MIPTLSIEGDKRALAMMKELEKLGSIINGADLHGKTRQEGGKDNGQVAQWLIKQGRDFFSTEAGAEAAAQAFADAVEERMAKATEGNMKAGAVAGYAWVQAMKAAMKVAAENINAGNFEGGGSEKLDPAYEKAKAAMHGFAYPIGKATGQLLDNLSSSNYGNIKLKRNA